MAKQMLFYEHVVPISKERHGGWSVEKTADFSYSADVNSCPLMVTEFRAAGGLPIVFSKTREGAMPVAVLGILPDQSQMVDGEGRWTGSYIPAFVRRYPFVFAQSEDGRTFTLCIDEGFAGIDRTGGRGERLFTDAGEPTPYLNAALNFAKTFEVESRRTMAFANLMEEHDLLDPMNAQITMLDGTRRALTGFSVISRERLKALPAEVVQDLFERDALELIYVHLMSVKNIEALRDLAGAPSAD